MESERARGDNHHVGFVISFHERSTNRESTIMQRASSTLLGVDRVTESLRPMLKTERLCLIKRIAPSVPRTGLSARKYIVLAETPISAAPRMRAKIMDNRTEQTPWEKLDNAFRTVIRVSKEELLKEEARLKRKRERKRRAKKSS